MYSRYYFFLLMQVALSVVYSANAADAPFLKKCRPYNFKCLKETTQTMIPIFANGIPELGVQKMDPFTIRSLDASTPELKFILRDITGTGLKDCVAKKVQRELRKSKLFVKLLCSVDFRGKYEMKGNLHSVPIEGKGDAQLFMRKVVFSVDIDIGYNIDKDGNQHWTIKSWKYTYKLKDKSTIELENLFNGNEVLGRAARQLIASSNNEIVMDLERPMTRSIATKMIENMEHFFENVPASELSE